MFHRSLVTLIQLLVLRIIRIAGLIGSFQLRLQHILFSRIYFVHFRLYELPIELSFFITGCSGLDQRIDNFIPPSICIRIYSNPRIFISSIVGFVGTVKRIIHIHPNTIKTIILWHDIPQDMSLLAVIHVTFYTGIQKHFMETTVTRCVHQRQTIGFGCRIIVGILRMGNQLIIGSITQRHFLPRIRNNKGGVIIRSIGHELFTGHMIDVIHKPLSALDSIQIRFYERQFRISPIGRP